jgi:hypothetical protein
MNDGIPHVACAIPSENVAPTFVRTRRLKVKSEAYPWLNAAATEANVAWNYANEISARAARPVLIGGADQPAQHFSSH